MADLSKPWKSSFVRLSEIDHEMLIHNLVAISLFFFCYLRKSGRGSFRPLPSGRRLIVVRSVHCAFSLSVKMDAQLNLQKLVGTEPIHKLQEEPVAGVNQIEKKLPSAMVWRIHGVDRLLSYCITPFNPNLM